MLRGFALALVLVALGCSSTPDKEQGERAKVDPTRPPPTSAELPAGGIVKTSRSTGFTDMIEDLAEADFVYVGERHDNADHHLAQLRVIEHLQARGRLHAIGMEQFQRPFQSVLDAYTEGRIGEEEMLERTEYKKRWGFPYELYRPILEFARRWRIPVVALNVEVELKDKVSKDGLEGLSNSERARLPAIDTSNDRYKQSLIHTYKAHLKEDETFDREKFDRFFLIQCLWDQVMADSIVRWSRTAPKNAQIVVLAGTGHISRRWGIPENVKKRLGKTHRTVVPISVTKFPPPRTVFAESYADYVWLTGK